MSSSPNRPHRHHNYGYFTVHQYHYPDLPPKSSRRPSDSIRERGREVIERERARAAAEDQQFAVADDAKSVWEPVFDEADERTGGREYYDVTEGSARQRIQRRREKDDPQRREERSDDFFR